MNTTLLAATVVFALLAAVLAVIAHQAGKDLQAVLVEAAEAEKEASDACRLVAEQRERMKKQVEVNLRLVRENDDLQAQVADLSQALDALCGQATWTPEPEVADTLVLDRAVEADADATRVLTAIDPARPKTHPQCKRAHERGDHASECVLCTGPLHQVAVSDVR